MLLKNNHNLQTICPNNPKYGTEQEQTICYICVNFGTGLIFYLGHPLINGMPDQAVAQYLLVHTHAQIILIFIPILSFLVCPSVSNPTLEAVISKLGRIPIFAEVVFPNLTPKWCWISIPWSLVMFIIYLCISFIPHCPMYEWVIPFTRPKKKSICKLSWWNSTEHNPVMDSAENVFIPHFLQETDTQVFIKV